MSRQVFLLGVGVTAVALALIVTDWLLGLAPGVTEANARRIKPGMTLAEVKAILGDSGQWCLTEGGNTSCWDVYRWTASRNRVYVFFSRKIHETTGTVTGDGATFHREAAPPLLDRLRTWLGW